MPFRFPGDLEAKDVVPIELLAGLADLTIG
jgi:hypothetical protein